MTPKNEVGAADWLASRGLADLSLYWPHPKPIPQKDYPASEPQPTLTGIMEAYAESQPEPSSPSVGAQRLSPELLAEYAEMWHSGELDHATAARAVGLLLNELAQARHQIEELARRIAAAQQEQNKAWIVACLKFLKPSGVIIPKGHDLSPEEILKMFLPPTGRGVSRD